MHYHSVLVSDRCTRFQLKLGLVLTYQDLTRQEVEEEPTRTYLRRVLVSQYQPQRPLTLKVAEYHSKKQTGSNPNRTAARVDLIDNAAELDDPIGKLAIVVNRIVLFRSL